jgi:hypothetical protein
MLMAPRIFVWTLAFALACSSNRGGPADAGPDSGRGGIGGSTGQGGAAAGEGGAGGACPVDGKSFFSRDEMECGLNDSDAGVALCFWRVSFLADGTFTWTYSDTGATGTYTCNGAVVTGERAFGAGTIVGSYDAASGQLTWAGAVYLPQP